MVKIKILSLLCILIVSFTLGCTGTDFVNFIFPGACDQCICEEPTLNCFEGTSEVVFCQKKSCAETLIKYIDSANDTIYFAIYSFTYDPIAEALFRASDRGVEIYGILDNSQSNNVKYFDFDFELEMLNHGIYIVKDKNSALMHNKVLVVDDYAICTGSYNWSNNAEYNNDENLICLIDEPVVVLYKNYLIELYGEYL